MVSGKVSAPIAHLDRRTLACWFYRKPPLSSMTAPSERIKSSAQSPVRSSLRSLAVQEVERVFKVARAAWQRLTLRQIQRASMPLRVRVHDALGHLFRRFGIFGHAERHFLP